MKSDLSVDQFCADNAFVIWKSAFITRPLVIKKSYSVELQEVREWKNGLLLLFPGLF